MKLLFHQVLISNTVLAIIFMSVLVSTLYPITHGAMFSAKRFIVSAQGKNRCPDFWYSGSRRIVVLRSHLECARNCALWSECLHYSYQRNNGSCALYSNTPANLYPAGDCSFMLDPATFEGCLSAATMRMDPDGCSFPFQFENKEYNQCITVAQNSTPQCVASNGQLTDCVAPSGFSVQQYVSELPVGTNAPLPCISNWIILMSHYTGGVNFTRNWNEYKNGFGDSTGSDFWIGNENMYAITNKPGMAYMLRVEMQTNVKGLWFYAEFESFRVDSEANFYALHVDGYNGNSGDSLSNITSDVWQIQTGMHFSTYDVDNDMSNAVPACAVLYNGGFWFNNCGYSCLTCMNGTKHFSWWSLQDYGLQTQGRLRAARMMIRSI